MSRGDEMARRSFASLARLGTVAHTCMHARCPPPSPRARLPPSPPDGFGGRALIDCRR